MKKWMLVLGLITMGALTSMAAAKVGEPAPDVGATDADGKTIKISDFRGKYVVLEWINPGCPYVKRHYEAGTMQAAQKAAAEKGATWLQVSTGKGKVDWKKYGADTGSKAATVLLDTDAVVAKAFGAKTTPHMFVIAPDGNLIYQGAIDDNPDSPKGAKNYVLAAIDEAIAGKPVTTPTTKPYGCGVHYSK